MTTEIIKLLLQTVILGIIGGAITYYYNKLQKNRELTIHLSNQLASVHTDLISLRYKFNTLFTEIGKPIRSIMDDNEISKLKWKYYEEACVLIAKFQSLKPMLLKFIPEEDNTIRKMDGHYQNFRRSIRRNELIFQDKDSKSEENLKELKNQYQEIQIKLNNKV
jgi:hypothetical protein